jgi:hypothetical protein
MEIKGLKGFKGLVVGFMLGVVGSAVAAQAGQAYLSISSLHTFPKLFQIAYVAGVSDTIITLDNAESQRKPSQMQMSVFVHQLASCPALTSLALGPLADQMLYAMTGDANSSATSSILTAMYKMCPASAGAGAPPDVQKSTP